MRAAVRSLTQVARRTDSVVYLALAVLTFFIGAYMVRLGGVNKVAIGTGLISTAIAAWVNFLWVALQADRSARTRRVSDAGLLDAFPQRSIAIKAQYDPRLASARKHIDILGFGLNSLRQDYGADFERWAQKAQVRILLMDPSSPFAAVRDEEERQDVGTISREVTRFVDETRALRITNSKFQVRLYKHLPSLNLLRADDEMFFGPYLVSQPSRSTPTLLLRRGMLFDQLIDHFEELWKDSVSAV